MAPTPVANPASALAKKPKSIISIVKKILRPGNTQFIKWSKIIVYSMVKIINK